MKISQEEKLRNEKVILETASQMMAEKSFSEVSLRDISIQAGLSQATAYKYFKTKENMIFRFFELIQDECREKLTEIPDFGNYHLEEQIQILLETQLEILEKNRSFVSQILHDALNLDFFQSAQGFAPVREKYESMIHDLLQAAIEAGEISKPPVYGFVLRSFWDLYVFVLIYWIKDHSSHYTNTTQLIEKILGVSKALLQSQVLSKTSDLFHFVIKEHVFSLLDKMMKKKSTPVEKKSPFEKEPS
ncbi:MAG: TetR family transcriptional regulator [Bdellovibrionota bacterium]